MDSHSQSHLDAFLKTFVAAQRTPSTVQIGLEYEKILFDRDQLMPLSFAQITEIMQELARRDSQWSPIMETDPDNPHGRQIGLASPTTGSVTLEPGGQFEHSAAIYSDLHQTALAVDAHLEAVFAVLDDINADMLCMGFSPTWKLEQIPKPPKQRYQIMREIMPKVGTTGVEMMHKSCTVQMNLDYTDEADMVRKMRLGTKLQSVVASLFCCSPYRNGSWLGNLSERNRSWKDVDPERAGLPLFVFEPDFGYRRWLEYVMHTPMYFISQSGTYKAMYPQTFESYFLSAQAQAEGRAPSIQDWKLQMSFVFPELRLRPHIEMRGADCPGWDLLIALGAMWTGLFYDADALNAVEDLVAAWEIEDVVRHYAQLGTSKHEPDFVKTARETIVIAREGLKRRAVRASVACKNKAMHLDVKPGMDESVYLDNLEQLWEGWENASAVPTPAARLLNRTQGDPAKCFEHFSYGAQR